jgi:hypothetical protein
MMTPDYTGGGILNLMSSLVSAQGGAATGYSACSLLEDSQLNQARQVLLLVVDGLGWNYLNREGAGGYLHSLCIGPLSSVVPPTTAAAIPVFFTAAPPARHGFTGWFTWLRELGCVSAVLPYVTRYGHLPLGEGKAGPLELSQCDPVTKRLPVECHVVSPRNIAHSVFNRGFSGGAEIHAYDDMAGFFSSVRNTLRYGAGRRYVHAYWSDLDTIAHVHGIGSRNARQHLEQFDHSFGRLLRELQGTDTAVVVTADHGFVDVPAERVVHMDDHPELADCLTLPLCGEPRIAYCYVKPGRRECFESYVRSELSEQMTLRASEDLIDAGFFGPGPRHPQLAHRVGDYTLLLKENYMIKDHLPGEHDFELVGRHGGLSADELLVPLVCATA